MASNLSAAPDFHLTIPQSDKRRPIFFTAPIRQNLTKKRLTISCNSSRSSPKSSRNLKESLNPKNPSLSDQLKPLSATTLSTTKDNRTHLLSKPKSTWVNPTKPRKSVLSLQRQKRSPYSLNPIVKELRLFAQKLNDCDSSNETTFLSLLEQIPYPLTRENALLILNSLKPWQKAHLFFNWIKTQNSFPMETIFYNVVMKSLRFGRQFELIDNLANEMLM